MLNDDFTANNYLDCFYNSNENHHWLSCPKCGSHFGLAIFLALGYPYFFSSGFIFNALRRALMSQITGICKYNCFFFLKNCTNKTLKIDWRYLILWHVIYNCQIKWNELTNNGFIWCYLKICNTFLEKKKWYMHILVKCPKKIKMALKFARLKKQF